MPYRALLISRRWQLLNMRTQISGSCSHHPPLSFWSPSPCQDPMLPSFVMYPLEFLVQLFQPAFDIKYSPLFIRCLILACEQHRNSSPLVLFGLALMLTSGTGHGHVCHVSGPRSRDTQSPHSLPLQTLMPVLTKFIWTSSDPYLHRRDIDIS